MVVFDKMYGDWPTFVIPLDQTNLVTGQSKPLVAVKLSKKGSSSLKCKQGMS